MKINFPFFSSAFAFLLATSCCWLPWLAVILGGAAGGSALAAGLEKFKPAFWALGAVLLGWGGWQFWQKRKRQEGDKLVLQSLLTCPNCGFQKVETMPTDACQFFYECENCHAMLRPKTGDCCVFCSYGTAKCPPVQSGKDCC